MSPVAGIGPSAGSVPPVTPILDQISGSVFSAFSLRKLRGAYAGKAINVRRDSDNATQDIGFTTRGDLDLTSLLAFVGSANGFVTTWYDQVSSHNLTAVSGQQPRIINSGVVDVTPIDATPALYFGWPTSLVTNGTNNIYLQSASGLSFAQGDSIFVHSNPYAGPGLLAVNNGNKPGLLADEIYYSDSSFQQLGTDHQGITPGSNGYPNDDQEPVSENNLNGVQGNNPTFGTNTAIKWTYGGPNVQTNWINFQSANHQMTLGFVSPTATGDCYGGYIMEMIINGSGNAFSNNDKATIFGNQSSYYHIDTSRIADAVNEQMTAGYSTRKLRKGYTGNCLKVREDVGNTTKDIGFVGNGNLDTVGLINFVTANGANPTANGFVTTWYDQSVWGNIFSTNAVQATNANQPQIVSSGAIITQNGKPVLFFNQGISGSITLQSSAGSGATSGVWAGVISKFTGTLPFPSSNFPTSVATFTSTWQAVVQGAQNNSFWQSGIAGAVNVNNTGSATATANLEQDIVLAGPQNQIAFGTLPGNGTSSFTGYIGEFVGFTSTLAAGDQTVLYNNQKAWWGTP